MKTTQKAAILEQLALARQSNNSAYLRGPKGNCITKEHMEETAAILRSLIFLVGGMKDES